VISKGKKRRTDNSCFSNRERYRGLSLKKKCRKVNWKTREPKKTKN